MNEQSIERQYLEKAAFVYLRQSSPTQVKRNVESGRRQRGMEERVKELGWPATEIQVLGGDTGLSGSTVHGRDDYQVMLGAILSGNAGLIAARELSRLARDNQDWNHLVRLCRHQDVLLMDEHRLYHASDPQDRVVLGITGAFNEFEISMIIDRMLESQRQKAARGELYEGRFSPGFVCRVEPLCEKHPDERVQRAVVRVFDHFDRCVSVLQLHREFAEKVLVGVNVPNLALAQPGDKVELDAWHPPETQGKAIANSVFVSLAKPLVGVTKKVRNVGKAPSGKASADPFGVGDPLKDDDTSTKKKTTKKKNPFDDDL